ncbi:hypothetical protein BT67DRAFT_72920 [Trichocladium antarcticum]|uniref:Uncharacterized protein n=1 Tax=Trichocladium antarcticum TaxID=1450529 RepID=A0AAN6UHF4_9PEZI|nr:hypothetical protein BT67DRAFT_72920 [Trichocladium antarcticum]
MQSRFGCLVQVEVSKTAALFHFRYSVPVCQCNCTTPACRRNKQCNALPVQLRSSHCQDKAHPGIQNRRCHCSFQQPRIVLTISNWRSRLRVTRGGSGRPMRILAADVSGRIEILDLKTAKPAGWEQPSSRWTSPLQAAPSSTLLGLNKGAVDAHRLEAFEAFHHQHYRHR